MDKKKVAVIGAGVSGLVTIKSCLEEGLEVQAFEQSHAIGGNWQFKENDVSVFRYTELTSSKYATAFSDFPMPDHYPHFLKHEQYLEYLLAYVRHFDLERHIKLEVCVDSVQKRGDKWIVSFNQSGLTEEYECDHVAVCTGLNKEPKLPKFEGQEQFSGEIIHSSYYKDNSAYQDKNMVVVGCGESGADIVTELSRVAKKVTLSLNRGVFVIPKIGEGTTIPLDSFLIRAYFHLPAEILWGVTDFFLNSIVFILRPKNKSWQTILQLWKLSGGNIQQQYAVKSNTIIETLNKPNVDLKPGIKHLDSDGVTLNDGSQVQADGIICCSGFNVSFPFLPIDSKGWSWHKLYKKMFHPEIPNVGFIGFARPDLVSQPTIMELQARYFAGVACGRLSLPNLEQMKLVIKQDYQESARLKPLVYNRITGIVNWTKYMCDMSALIGCFPSIKELIKQPVVLWYVLFGTLSSTHFRICGVHSNPVAVEQLKKEGLQLGKFKTIADYSLYLLAVIPSMIIYLLYPIFRLLSRLPGLSALRPYVNHI